MTMRRPVLLFGSAALAAAVACGTGSDEPPGVTKPSTGGKAGASTGGKGGAGGSSGRQGTGGSGDVGGASGADDGGAGSSGGSSAGEGQGGTSASGGAATGGGAGIAIAGRGEEPDPCVEQGDDPPAAPGVCEPGAAFGPGEPVAVMASAADPFVAVTPDELTLLFLHVTSIGEAMIADREDAGDDFGEPVSVGIDGVIGLSPDGLRVVVRAFDGTLQEAARAAPGEEFGDPAEGAFNLINAAAAADGASVGTPVIAPDDRTLYYLVLTPGGTDYPLHVSTRSGTASWPVGAPVKACELKTFQGFNPVPTGVSSDGLTLFFYDSFYGVARAGFRESAGGPFVWFDELGPLVSAQPNAACNRLYYSGDGILYASSR